jgi:predicted MPP superfamily phosphohydrolase
VGRLLVFVTIITALMVALGYYVGTRLIPAQWTGAARMLAWGGLGTLIVSQPLAFLSRFIFGRGGASDAVAWLGFVCMGLFLLLLTFTVARDLGWLGAKVAGGLPTDPARRRAMFDATSAAVLGVSGGAFAIGMRRALAHPSVVEVTVPIANLPAALEGFVIAQISDIHVGPTIKKAFIESIVTTVNGINADLVAITGDVVDGSVAQLGEHTAPFANLKGRHGAFFVTGNHEYYSGALEWIDEMARLGVKPLVNAHHVVDHDGAQVVIGGVTDYTAASVMPEHKTDPHKAIAGAPADAALRLLLAHQPRSAYAAAEAGWHLQLSGHTHGGQFFPGNFLIHLVQPFVEGLHQLESMWVYTNRGTGYWGPPVRHTASPSEVTKLTLVRA